MNIPGAAPGEAASGMLPGPRITRRYRRQVLFVLLASGLLPLLIWGVLSRSLLEGALALAPPVGAVLQRGAAALDVPGRDPALAEQLRAAELHVMQADLARRRLLERAPLSFVLALIVAAGLIATAAWLLGRRLSRPVETLAAGMARIGRGELAHQVPLSGRRDELDYLATALNQMGRELQRQRARLQVTEALAAWRDAARVLAHDLKNPLTAMRMAVGRLARPDRTPAALGEAVSLLQDELDVLIRMSHSFSEFARLPTPQRAAVDLATLVSQVVALSQTEAPGTRFSLTVEVRPSIVGDADQLRRALGNLLKNAVEAHATVIDGADAAIAVTLRAGDDGEHVRLSVRDQGVGITAPLEGTDLMAGLRSAKPGADRGLGLPIAHKIIHEHGGRLRLLPAPPRGTEALVDFPLQPVAPMGASS